MARTTKRPRLNSVRIKTLWQKQARNEKSITEIAEAVGGTYMGVRLNLIRQRLYRP